MQMINYMRRHYPPGRKGGALYAVLGGYMPYTWRRACGFRNRVCRRIALLRYGYRFSLQQLPLLPALSAGSYFYNTQQAGAYRQRESEER